MNPTFFLKAAGCSSIFLGLFHVPFLFLGENAARFFSAPPFVRTMIREDSPWLFVVVAAILMLFGIFGAYPFSAAGMLKRRLPRELAMLRTIAVIYTLRGLVVIPQILLLIRKPDLVPPQTALFSAVALLVAAFYWLGIQGVDKRVA